MKRKYGKIEANITLSIQYARLLEEISDAEQKVIALQDKKDVVGLNKKKMKELKTHIEKTDKIIKKIEDNYKQKEYKVVLNNQLEQQLNLLSHCEYFEMIKYNISIKTILDSSINYQKSGTFLEDISETLFQENSTIKSIEQKLIDIYYVFNDDDSTKKTNPVVGKLPLALPVGAKFLGKKLKFLANPMVVQAVTFAVGAGNGFVKKRVQIKKMKKLSDTEFEYVLTTTLLCLFYAKEVLPEIEYKQYCSFKLKVINSARATIVKEFFEDRYDVKENLVKINLLKTFDNYLIEDIKF